MKEEIGRLVKQTGIYGLGPILSRPEFVEQFRYDRLAEQLASVFDSASNHGE